MTLRGLSLPDGRRPTSFSSFPMLWREWGPYCDEVTPSNRIKNLEGKWETIRNFVARERREMAERDAREAAGP